MISLLTRAIQFQRDQFQRDQRGTTERLITGSAILYGHDEMSKEKRTTYLHAEFPHKWEIIGKLVRGGTEYNDAAMNRLFGKQRDAAVDDLISMGVLERAAKDGNLGTVCLSCTDAGWSALNGSWLPEDSPATLCRRTLGGPPVLATQRQPGSVGLAQATDALARASRDFHSALSDFGG